MQEHTGCRNTLDVNTLDIGTHWMQEHTRCRNTLDVGTHTGCRKKQDVGTHRMQKHNGCKHTGCRKTPVVGTNQMQKHTGCRKSLNVGTHLMQENTDYVKPDLCVQTYWKRLIKPNLVEHMVAIVHLLSLAQSDIIPPIYGDHYTKYHIKGE